MDTKLRVSKLEAGKRQLETAIILYFNYGDTVSIHTLSAAAYGVLRDLNEKRGGEPMFKEPLWQLMDTPELREYRKLINQPENFFKHSDRNPDDPQGRFCRNEMTIAQNRWLRGAI